MSLQDELAKIDLNKSVANVNIEGLRQDALGAIQNAARLKSYADYLTAMRQQNVRGATELDVIAQARRAADDARQLMGRTLAIVRQMRNSGLVDELLSAVERAATANGIRIDEPARQAFSDPAIQGVLENAGLTANLVTALQDWMKNVPVTVSRGPAGNFSVQVGANAPTVVVRHRPVGAAAGTLLDAIAVGQLDRLVDRLQGPQPWTSSLVPSATTANIPAPVDSIALLAGSAEVLVQESVRHVRKLEDTGLEAYHGQDISLATVIIVAACIYIATAVVFTMMCYYDKDKKEKTFKNECDWAKFMWTVGMSTLFTRKDGTVSNTGTVNYQNNLYGPNSIPVR